jgi:lipopolysaccharide export system protein LptA
MTGAWAQLPDIEMQKTLPIALDADSSEFDRKNDKLLFSGLRITQGSLHIEADEAEASRLDFENSQWTFSGNVVIENVGTIAFCDYAEILFRDHLIENAMMSGSPVKFSQNRPEDDSVTRGRANIMEYSLQDGIIRMSEDAWLSDGANEVSGNRITYDLVREFIMADADESGQVRMKITPPEKDLPKREAEQSP